MKLILYLGVLVLPTVHCMAWLSLHHLSHRSWGDADHQCRAARARGALNWDQTLLCRTRPGLLSAIVTAASTTVSSCQRLFRHSRWNCSSVALAPNFSADLTLGTREQAVVHALGSAALVWTVARACRQGAVMECGCGALPTEPPNGRFQWGGCGDNILYAYSFNKEFFKPRKKSYQRERLGVAVGDHSRGLDVQRITRRHRKNERRKEARRRREKKRRISKELSRSRRIKKRAVKKMDRHNRRVGRKATSVGLSTSCKCHGVSGSCALKTCWKVLASFNKVSGRLLRRYSSAVAVRPVKVVSKLRLLPVSAGGVSSYSRDDLLYVASSPDYCTPQPQLGSLGTHGRKCNASSVESDSCELLCCGRGHTASLYLLKQPCACRYHWCCHVTCDTCSSWKTQHYCL
ncbi:protein Wnt-11b [Hyalella azteca]|uniref:Protein Wnt n=1 Tax=Hyalella azteca TaxID=294128 RepID=A0A8B7N9E7_HYAAZ|nr:protein Wnt-11b [Hyalella azteca]